MVQSCHIFLSALLWSAILPVTAEIREFDQLLKADDRSIWATDGYLRAPGFIDISALSFEAVGDAFGALGDDEVVSDDEVVGDDQTGDDGGGGGALRFLEQYGTLYSYGDDNFGNSENSTRRGLDESVNEDSFVLDVAVFKQPDKCAKKGNCNWPDLGIGAEKDDGKTLRWCCSQDAIGLGLCAAKDLGRLIVKDTFHGNHRFINIPLNGDMMKTLKFGKFEEGMSGRYVVIFANCNANGRDIKVRGNSVWKSTHGYLPGELFGYLYFYLGLAVVYILLTFWFGCLMQANKESRIPIEKWIFMTILMGLCEMCLRSSAYVKLNNDGFRPDILIYFYIIVGVLKRGVSRGLMVMVSLGWGVIRDSLGSTMKSIVVLASAYIGVSAFCDLTNEFAIEDIRNLTDDAEDELIKIVTILIFIVAIIDVVFVLWILDALNGTMEYLESMNQLRKLGRYLRLRSILLFAILFATIWIVFALVNNFNEDPIVLEEHAWIVEAATEINYLYVLIGISLLWRPNPSAREYAHVMELPSTGGEDDGAELELPGVVPSAMDDDDDVPTAARKDKGYHDHDGRFAIDEAQHA